MSEENKTDELKKEELGKVFGGNGGEAENNWTITINCTVSTTKFFVKEDTISLQVSPNTTVSEVKQMINDKENVDTAAQRLIFMGKELNDSNTLSNSGVVNGSEIYLLVRIHY